MTTTKKERAQSPCETAPESNTHHHSNPERDLYHPLTWRAKSRIHGKQAIEHKRGVKS